MMKKMNIKTFLTVRSIILFLLLGIFIAINCVAVSFDEVLTSFAGTVGGKVGAGEIYFKSEYKTKSESKAAALKLIEETVSEGAVLLKNENNALPIKTSKAKKAKISLFGTASANFILGGSGSGASNTSGAIDLKSAMVESNFDINPVLWDFYSKGVGKNYGNTSSSGVGGLEQKVSEVPLSKYSTLEKSSFANYKDAAIVVIGRSGSEGVDLTRNLAKYNDKRKDGVAAYVAGQHYLEISKEERDLLEEVNLNFENVVVIINSPNAMELGFVDEPEYGVNACLWVGAVGQTGTKAVAKIISGEVNPSGRLADTYVFDNFSSPAMQNFGDYKYEESKYYYVTYAEGIYVGYKYYETRYEDKILGNGNAGDYDYDKVVKYPFGYGLSYTDFVWSDFNAQDKGDTIQVDVTVLNNGALSGKEVVEIYVQAPYIAGGIEKSAIQLVGFSKSNIIKAGESERVSVSIEKSGLQSFDMKNGKYIADKGNYYVTAAKNAHEALENVISKKDTSTETDSEFVFQYDLHEKLIEGKTSTGYDYANRFEDADLANVKSSAYDASFKYLSRNNWTETFPKEYKTATSTQVSDNVNGFVGTRAANAELIKQLEMRGYDAAGNPKDINSYVMATTGKSGNSELIQLRGESYKSDLWDGLLDQVEIKEMIKVIQMGGYTTAKIESINKPRTYDFDGPAGLSSFMAKVDSCSFPVEVVIASTWNKALAEKIGNAIGEESLWSNEGGRSNGVNGWYAPAMNIHRTPFSGRNFEYYSEDANLSALIGSAQTKGVQNKGVYCYLKHFALNDQESNRAASTGGLGLVTWSNEQAIREIYLEPFRVTVEDNAPNGTLAIMSSFNRIGTRWAGGSYALLTEVLRNEWGFKGLVLTDYWESPYMEAMQMLAAGGDATLINVISNDSKLRDTTSPMAVSLMRQAIKNVCFTVVNSSAMNGVEYGVAVVEGFPIYLIILIIFDILSVVGIVVLVLFTLKKLKTIRSREKIVKKSN